MRAFLALELAPEIKVELERLTRRLSALTSDIRWVRPEGMHLTLKFLGEISEAMEARVRAAMVSVASRHKPFSLGVRCAGSFPAASRRPRVIWAGVEAGPELGSLHKDVEVELGREGFPAEARAFHPHITLGRAKSVSKAEALVEELERNSSTEFGRMTSEGMTLFQSRLQPGGAVYAVLERFPLK